MSNDNQELELRFTAGLDGLYFQDGAAVFEGELQRWEVMCEGCHFGHEGEHLRDALNRARAHANRTKHEVSVFSEYGWRVSK